MLKEIQDHREQITELCCRYGVRRLEIFGSAARGEDFFPGRSDVDFLVDFSEGQVPKLDGYLDLQEELSELLAHNVKLAGRKAILNKRNYIRRNSILRDLETVYG